MKTPLSIFLVKVWAAVGWANGNLPAKVRIALDRMISRLPEVGPSDRQAATAAFARSVDIPDSSPELAELARLPIDIRRDIYLCAKHIALLDQGLSPAEQQFLRKLRNWLLLDDSTVQQIDSLIPKS